MAAQAVDKMRAGDLPSVQGAYSAGAMYGYEDTRDKLAAFVAGDTATGALRMSSRPGRLG